MKCLEESSVGMNEIWLHGVFDQTYVPPLPWWT
jgi:hypothetical protein